MLVWSSNFFSFSKFSRPKRIYLSLRSQDVKFFAEPVSFLVIYNKLIVFLQGYVDFLIAIGKTIPGNYNFNEIFYCVIGDFFPFWIYWVTWNLAPRWLLRQTLFTGSFVNFMVVGGWSKADRIEDYRSLIALFYPPFSYGNPVGYRGVGISLNSLKIASSSSLSARRRFNLSFSALISLSCLCIAFWRSSLALGNG